MPDGPRVEVVLNPIDPTWIQREQERLGRSARMYRWLAVAHPLPGGGLMCHPRYVHLVTVAYAGYNGHITEEECDRALMWEERMMGRRYAAHLARLDALREEAEGMSEEERARASDAIGTWLAVPGADE